MCWVGWGRGVSGNKIIYEDGNQTENFIRAKIEMTYITGVKNTINPIYYREMLTSASGHWLRSLKGNLSWKYV